ncbi:hypothetical protein [Cohnella nanjingensis]|nr:hypothetical protein [Cohnella nanjingensis]
MTRRHKYVLVVLFVYRLLWGFFLYRFIDSLVTTVLSRYPDPHPNNGAVRLFLIEAQFRLLKTNLIDEVLWMLAGMLLIRMLLTPLLNAGIYYSFQHANESDGTRVMTGIRSAWKPVTLLYWIENLLALLPAAWLIPMAKTQYLSNPSEGAWLREILPYAGAWALWAFLLHLLFLFMQFSAVSQDRLLSGLGRACRQAFPLLAVSVALFALGTAASLAITASSLLWTGFLTVALHQAFQLVRALLTLWTAASQHQLWKPDHAA